MQHRRHVPMFAWPQHGYHSRAVRFQHRGAPSVTHYWRATSMSASHPARTSASMSKFSTPVQKLPSQSARCFWPWACSALFRASPRTMTSSPSPAITSLPHFSESSTCRCYTTWCTCYSVLLGSSWPARSTVHARTSSVAAWCIWCSSSTGLVIDHDSSANFVPVNDADNWLHLGLAVAMIALGAALGRTRDDSGQPVGTGGPGSSSNASARPSNRR